MTYDIDDVALILLDIKESILQARDPIDFPIQLSASMPWMVDYHNRKHLFIYSPIALTLSLEDYGTNPIAANVWHNIEFPAGMRVYASNQPTPVYAYIKATDEPLIQDYNNTVAIAGTTISGTTATVFAAGELRVQSEPTEVFLADASEGTIDTTNRWKAPTAAGGGVAAAIVSATYQLGTGTTANGYSYLESQPSFIPANPGWLQYQSSINLPAPYIANTYLFWGAGTSPATPTAAAPLTDAVGFEIAIGGKMFAVTYAGGTRNVIADLSASTGSNKQPADGSAHIYTIFFRGDRTYWTIDGLDNVVGSFVTGALGPNTNTLPIKFTTIAGAIAPASSAVLTINQTFVADTTGRETQISDGTFPWRKTTVDANGNLAVSDTYLYTPISTNTTVTIKSGAGTLHNISINNPGSAWIITVYDNTTATGTPIAVITAVAGLIITLTYDVRLNTGLTVVTSGTTAGHITVASR